MGRITTDKDGAIIRIKMGAPKAFKPSFGMNIMLFSLDYEVSYHNSIPYVEDSKMVIKISDGGVKNLLIESSASIQDIQW